MANQSKSMVFGFVIIAAIIFAVALGYKMTQNDDNQAKTTANKPVVQQVEPETESQAEIKVVSYDKKKADMAEQPTPEEQAEIEANSPYFMQFAMRFKSGEEAVENLPVLIKLDKFEEAEFLVKFIKSQYPNTKIPDEFADL